MPRNNGPPRYFLEAVEMVVGGLPVLLEHFKQASEIRREELEPIIQALSALKSLLGDFFNDLKPDGEIEDEETENINT